MEKLETILGHTFRDPSLLRLALTHASVSYENQRFHEDNQRLEFLGDAVIQLSLSHFLYRKLPNADEGVLTKSRAHLVSTKALARLARRLGLGDFLIMGRGEEANGGRERDSSLADVMEAITGAVYLDAGLEVTSAFVAHLFAEDLQLACAGQLEPNPKGQLQEQLQAISQIPPSYDILSEKGPDHAKYFVASVSWMNQELGRGSGRSKKEAEAQAAQQALDTPGLENRLRIACQQQDPQVALSD
jgi:ribonuclease-3